MNQTHNRMPDIRIQNIGDADIQYLAYDGKGPTLILMHATGFSPWLWHPIARELADSFNVIAPYFCAHRKCDPEKGGVSWRLLAEDLIHFCDGLDITEPYLAGHSMGGTVATLANALSGNMAREMILIEPIFLPEEIYQAQITVEEHWLASKAIKRRNYWKDRSELVDDLKSKPFFQSWDDEMLDIYMTYGFMASDNGGLQLKCSPKREASLFMGGIVYDPWPLMPGVSCPVLIVEGELSENRSYIDLQKARHLFKNGTYQLVPDAGHLVPMEKPEQIVDIIKTFFTSG